MISITRCVRDETWGTPGDGSEIWLKDGCRGQFHWGFDFAGVWVNGNCAAEFALD